MTPLTLIRLLPLQVVSANVRRLAILLEEISKGAYIAMTMHLVEQSGTTLEQRELFLERAPRQC